jgi:hypothetical protein
VQETISSAKYIDSSATGVGGLLKDDLSPIDLSTVSIANLVSTDDINIAVLSMAPKLSSVNSFQAPADKIVKVMPKDITTEGVLAGITTSLPQTMVLVAPQSSDVEMCSTEDSTPMLGSLEWKSFGEVSGKKGSFALAKLNSDDGSESVNAFFVMEWK